MSKRSALVLMVGGIGLVAIVFAAWRILSPRTDMPSAVEHNNRGVALMDRFEYPAAQAEFEQVVKSAPDWTTGHINLGISLLNQAGDAQIDRAIKEFNLVLGREPDNLHAHYCLGFVLTYHKKFSDAIPHYERVTKLDPDDPGAWYQLGVVLTQQSALDPENAELQARALKCFENAHRLNPYMSGPLANLFPRMADEKQKEDLLKFDADLRATGTMVPNSMKYTEQGSKYACVIGRAEPTPETLSAETEMPSFGPFDKFEVKLAANTKWAKSDDLGSGAIGDLRRLVRRRFGATIVTLDYDRDGRPDLFLPGAVVENGKLRDLLLRNDGAGVFTDVTTEAGLAGERASLGCAAADFDNDRFADLVITGAGRQYLFRNNGKGGFADVSAAAKLDQLKDVCLGCAWVDLDMDGDLDLVLARYADTPENAVALFAGRAGGKGGVAIFKNSGVADPVPANAPKGPLTVKFARDESVESALKVDGHPVAFAVTDADGDIDPDVVALADLAPAMLLKNERLLNFGRHFLDAAAVGQMWNGALTLDLDQDERTDLLLLPSGQSPLLLLNRGRPGTEPGKIYEKVEFACPPLRQARVVDIDLDGWPDVLGLTDDGEVRLLRNNRRGGFLPVGELPGAESTKGHLACLPVDVDGDGFADVLTWNETTGLTAWRNKGNGNTAVKVQLTGVRRNAEMPSERVNQDGFGARVTVVVGRHATTAELATGSAGLGQSSGPMVFGVGRARVETAVVRLVWPDMVVQAEFLNDPKGEFCSLGLGQVWELQETNRKGTSCPVLITWDGEQWVYVTDFLGEGSVGEMQAGGGTRVARPEESVKIEARQLRPKDGKYLLRIAEPMDEITYLDRLRLDVFDLPPGVDVFPDERFATGDPAPTQERLYFCERFFAKNAVDHRRRDVTSVLRERDGKMTGNMDYRSWLGFAGEHFVELDFGEQLAKFGPKQRLFILLAGWTDYPFPESIFAAKQAGVDVIGPTLERQGADGKWQTVCELGFPAGLPRVMTRDVTGLLAGRVGKLRIRTNMQVYWDQIFIAPALEGQGVATELGVAKAQLGRCGMLREIRKPGSPLIAYDPMRADRVPVTRWKGAFTRFGDVTELLTTTDDRYVIMGPGDDLTVSFDAVELRTLPAGWSRQYVLRTWGWCKDASPFTATGGSVGPLPFRAMKQYPPAPGERYPHPADVREWHTRLP